MSSAKSPAFMECIESFRSVRHPSLFSAPISAVPESQFVFRENSKPLKVYADKVRDLDVILISTCECNSCMRFNVKRKIKYQIAIIKRRTERLCRCNSRIKNPRRMRRLLRRLAKAEDGFICEKYPASKD